MDFECRGSESIFRESLWVRKSLRVGVWRLCFLFSGFACTIVENGEGLRRDRLYDLMAQLPAGLSIPLSQVHR